MLVLTLFLLFSTVSAGIVETFLAGIPRYRENETCAADLDRLDKCAAPFKDYFTTIWPLIQKNETEVYYNIGVMRKVVMGLSFTSGCWAESITDIKCEDIRYLKYFMDAFVYVGSKVYSDAFHCFINADVINTANECEKKLTGEKGYDNFQENSYKLTVCIAEQMYLIPESCPIDRIATLYKAAKAGWDMYYNALLWQRKELTEFPNFDSTKYCD